MFFTQDLNHDDEGGESFQQRVCILFRGFDRPTILLTEGYMWNDFGDVADIGAILYAYYYPQDMDLAAAFCSPFMTSLNDERFGPYLLFSRRSLDGRKA